MGSQVGWGMLDQKAKWKNLDKGGKELVSHSRFLHFCLKQCPDDSVLLEISLLYVKRNLKEERLNEGLDKSSSCGNGEETS